MDKKEVNHFQPLSSYFRIRVDEISEPEAYQKTTQPM
jgi:hypothetical protein